MATEKVGPTVLGKIVIVLFILVCLAAAGWFFRDTLFPGRDGSGTVDMDKFREQQGGAEAMDPTGITTVTEYKYIPAQKLPPVKGTSAYKWDAGKVVEFPINVWIGWLPIVAANNGFAPSTESVFYKKYGFKVNLKLIDDPVAARDAYAAGNSHILWGTLDMMALFAPELMKDSRTAPRIYQQIDWSNGGDGIVVRSKIASVRDLKGRTIVYAQNSPSQYFINNLLLNAGIQPGEVKHKFTSTAFEAAAAFVADPSIDACVSWAPDIYNIPEKVKNTRILTTTAEANKLIADVWAARADFAKDHPEVIEGLVAGHLRRDADVEGRHPEGPRLPVDGRGDTAWPWTRSAPWRPTPIPPTSPKTRSSSSTPIRRPTSSGPGRTSPSSTRSWLTRRSASTRSWTSPSCRSSTPRAPSPT